MKPLVDYGPAIEYLKWSTGQTLVDEPMNYTNSKQTITNWDGRYMGAMTARKALYASRNVPAVKALQEVGTDKAKEFVGRLGIETENLYESDAIGGGAITISLSKWLLPMLLSAITGSIQIHMPLQKSSTVTVKHLKITHLSLKWL